MNDAQLVVRELARRALLAREGDWNAAEQLCHQWLAEDNALKAQVIQACLELVIRHAVSTEGNRLRQQAADHLRDTREAEDRQREITQTVDEFLEDLRREGSEGTP